MSKNKIRAEKKSCMRVCCVLFQASKFQSMCERIVRVNESSEKSDSNTLVVRATELSAVCWYWAFWYRCSCFCCCWWWWWWWCCYHCCLRCIGILLYIRQFGSRFVVFVAAAAAVNVVVVLLLREYSYPGPLYYGPIYVKRLLFRSLSISINIKRVVHRYRTHIDCRHQWIFSFLLKFSRWNHFSRRRRQTKIVKFLL